MKVPLAIVTLVSKIVFSQNMFTQLVDHLNPSGIVCISESQSWIRELVELASQMEIQHIRNVQAAKRILSSPLGPDFLILLSLESSEALALIFESTPQLNLIHNTWIVFGNDSSLLTQSVALLKGKGQSQGFSPETRMFFLKDPGMNQIFHVNLRLLEPPLFKACGTIEDSCDMAQTGSNDIDYQGQSLIVSYESFVPFCIPSENGTTILGIFPEIVREAAKVLNLTVKYQPFGERRVWARKLKNGSWAGTLGEVQKGQIHTTVAGLIPTLERSDAIEFSAPLASTTFGLILKRTGNDDISARNYLDQFKPTSWICIFLMFLFCFVCLTTSLVSSKPKHQGLKQLSFGVETTFLALINKASKYKPVHLSQKIAMLSLFTMSLVLMAYYKGLLKAALSIRYFHLPINSWQDVLESPLDLIVNKGAYTEDFFKNSAPGTVHRDIYEEKIKDKKGYLETNDMDEVKQGKSLVFGGVDTRILLPEFPCQIMDVKRLRVRRQLTLPFAKNSPFFHSFKRVLLMLDESGTLDQIQDKYFRKIYLKELIKCNSQSSLGLSQTFLPFACLLIGIGLAMSLTLFERVKPKGYEANENISEKKIRRICNIRLLELTNNLPLEEVEALIHSLS